jgi:hypothetical protein
MRRDLFDVAKTAVDSFVVNTSEERSAYQHAQEAFKYYTIAHNLAVILISYF